MTQLLVGTRKGLFVLDGQPGQAFDVTTRAFVGESVEFATGDPRSGRYLASVTSSFYGPKIWYADDLAGEWQQASGLALPCSCGRRATPARAGRRTQTGCRSTARGWRSCARPSTEPRGIAARAVLRRDIGRDLRFGRCRRELAHGGQTASDGSPPSGPRAEARSDGRAQPQDVTSSRGVIDIRRSSPARTTVSSTGRPIISSVMSRWRSSTSRSATPAASTSRSSG